MVSYLIYILKVYTTKNNKFTINIWNNISFNKNMIKMAKVYVSIKVFYSIPPSLRVRIIANIQC